MVGEISGRSRKTKWRIWIAVAVLTLVIIASVIYMTELRKTPSQEVILTASDLPESGWKQNYLGENTEVAFDYGDSYESDVQRWNTSETIFIEMLIYHYDSSADAALTYRDFIGSNANWSMIDANVTVTPIIVGDNGSLWNNMSVPAFYPGGHAQELLFVKGSFFIEMEIRWSSGYNWTEADAIDLAHVQAEKIDS